MSNEVLVKPLENAADLGRLRVALCGSYRRDPEGLASAYSRLGGEFNVLSPASLDFVDPKAEFVRLAGELGESAFDVESRHLAAVAEADFVWLHAPGGYVGTSASLEIGHARALGIPVLTDAELADEMLRSMVTRVSGIDGIRAAATGLAGAGLAGLQSYYRRVSARRGWDNESARDTLLLITEEVGELARAVRKSEGLKRDGGFAGVDEANELADVQLYLVHLANVLGVDLASAVTNKERINAERFDRREDKQAA